MSEDQHEHAVHAPDRIEPLSDRSRAALEAATQGLITSLGVYFEAVRDVPADLSDEDQLSLFLPADTAVGEAVRVWNDAAGAHVKVSPLRLVDDDWANYEEEEDGDGEPGERAIPRRLSIVSRYDIDVTDPDALFTAALAAREGQGHAPEEMTQEAIRRAGVGNAIYTVRHGGAPYTDTPGLELRGGRTVYLAQDPTGPDPAPGLDTDETDPDLRLTLPPTGRIEFIETW